MLDFIFQNPIISALIALAGLGLLFGALLGFAAEKFKIEGDPVIDQIDGLLPQTQCGQCSYPGCRPYAEAISEGEAINKCPPGGQATVDSLATLLGLETISLDAEVQEDNIKSYAVIREAECIGCTKCIQACPVDAIVGAAKHMHTVIEDDCTGCDLCLEPCPVDCIDMLTIAPGFTDWHWPLPSTKTSLNIITSDRI